MKEQLARIIQETDWPFEKKGETVLEVMAGFGRNYDVLEKKFKNIEMLDGSKELSDQNKHPVVKHVSYIQKWQWPSDMYDAVVGVFCLCYLKDSELAPVLQKMENSLNDLGYIILMEPVLKPTETVH